MGGPRLVTSPAALSLPSAETTVRVRAIDTTTDMVCDSVAFVRPVLPGHEQMNLKTLCFLVENESRAKRVLFDCGARKDYWNGSPQTRRMIGGHVAGLRVKHSVDEILTDKGILLDSIDAIIWSHWHWDHIGDGSRFPASTNIVVGPGFRESFCPGYPIDPNGFVLASDLQGHHLHEISFDDDFRIGDFRAHDFFGDGSFYLLDVPGHAISHMCGLARTTPTTFLFMGGDCCHFTGTFRPTTYLPLSDSIVATQRRFLGGGSSCSCNPSGRILSDVSQTATANWPVVKSKESPVYLVTEQKDGAYTSPAEAQHSVNSLQAFDASQDVFVCLAHDGALFETLPFLNDQPDDDLSAWKSRGYKEKTHWGFLKELPRDGTVSNEPLVHGLRRDGKFLSMDTNLVFHEIPEQSE